MAFYIVMSTTMERMEFSHITSLPDYRKDAAAFQRAAHQAGAVVEDAFGDPIHPGQQAAAHRRTHKTWRNYYAPVFFGERPAPTPNQSTLSEDESEGSRYAADQYSTRQR
jgi:hypothetical protein